jgi:hypothetical protein
MFFWPRQVYRGRKPGFLWENHAPEADVTESNIDRAVRVLTAEVKEIVSSYFSPVRGVVEDVKRSVEQASRHSPSTDRSISDKSTTCH